MRIDTRFDVIRELGSKRYQSFLDAGYTEYYSGEFLRSTPYLLQKAIKNTEGLILFFVDVFVYDFSNIRSARPSLVGYQPEANFQNHLGNIPTFTVTLIDDEMTPAEIEAFFQRIYATMECEPYGNE